MIIHYADTRGKADHGWLKSYHTFSFAEYYSRERMHFGALRVINDDFIAPGMGFGSHPHRDMEIITVPLEGALQHKDSMGNSTIIRNGEVQMMSAGTGIIHSEFNASQTEAVKLLQIWVLPKLLNVKPRYDQKDFSQRDKKNKFIIVVSPDGRDDSVQINQDAFFSLGSLEKGQEVSYDQKMSGNGVYIFIIKGSVEVNGEKFKERDGVGIEEFKTLTLKTQEDSEILLMEVPLKI